MANRKNTSKKIDTYNLKSPSNKMENLYMKTKPTKNTNGSDSHSMVTPVKVYRSLKPNGEFGKEFKIKVRYKNLLNEKAFAVLDAKDLNNAGHASDKLVGIKSYDAKAFKINLTAISENIAELPIKPFVKTPGWHKFKKKIFFVTPNNPSSEAIKLLPSSSVKITKFHICGNLDEWKKSAELMKCSSLGITVMTAPFAALLLTPFNKHAFGFIISGKSSKGKSTLLNSAASIHGYYGREGLQSMSNTKGASREHFLGRKDTVYIADDINSADGDKNFISDLLRQFSMESLNGRSRERSNSHDMPIEASSQKTKTIFLSSSENNYSDRIRGEQVRLSVLDISLYGSDDIFDHELSDTVIGDTPEKRARTVERMERGFIKNQGVAFQKFLSAFLEDNQAKDEVKRDIRFFRRAANKFHHDSSYGRIARNLAVCYAAGRLAIKYGVLPLSDETLLNSLLKSFKVILENIASSHKNSGNAFDQLSDAALYDNFQEKLVNFPKARRNRDSKAPLSTEQMTKLADAKVISVKKSGDTHLLVRSEAMLGIYPTATRKRLVDVLKSKNLLQVGTKDTTIETTMPKRLETGELESVKSRFYKLSPSILKAH